MNHYKFIFAALCFMLASCGSKDEPVGEYVMPINKEYLPASVTFKKDDTAFLNRCRKWDNKIVIVNSADDLPDDPLGFTPSYGNINFANSSLLITYKLHKLIIDTCDFSYIYKGTTDTFEWSIKLGSALDMTTGNDETTFTRFAMEVPKLASDANVKVQLVLYDSGWIWDE